MRRRRAVRSDVAALQKAMRDGPGHGTRHVVAALDARAHSRDCVRRGRLRDVRLHRDALFPSRVRWLHDASVPEYRRTTSGRYSDVQPTGFTSTALGAKPLPERRGVGKLIPLLLGNSCRAAEDAARGRASATRAESCARARGCAQLPLSTGSYPIAVGDALRSRARLPRWRVHCLACARSTQRAERPPWCNYLSQFDDERAFDACSFVEPVRGWR
jgi:hypothetical protein